MKLKKSILKSSLVLLAVVLSAYTTSDVKNINVAESVINWVGYKVTGQHEGTINLLNGSLNFEKNKLVGGKFAMDMTTPPAMSRVCFTSHAPSLMLLFNNSGR